VARAGGGSGAVDPVLSALVLATRLAAGSSICGVVSTLPVTGRPWPRWRGALPGGTGQVAERRAAGGRARGRCPAWLAAWSRRVCQAAGTRPSASATTAGASASSTGVSASAAAAAPSSCRRTRPSGSA
jgi:hypothetical protein